MHIHNLIHPGEFVREDVLVPMGLDAKSAAARTGMDVGYLENLIAEKVDIDEKAAEAIGLLAGNGSQFWNNLQKNYDKARSV